MACGPSQSWTRSIWQFFKIFTNSLKLHVVPQDFRGSRHRAIGCQKISTDRLFRTFDGCDQRHERRGEPNQHYYASGSAAKRHSIVNHILHPFEERSRAAGKERSGGKAIPYSITLSTHIYLCLLIQCDIRLPSVMRLAPVPTYTSFTDVYRFYTILKQVIHEEFNDTNWRDSKEYVANFSWHFHRLNHKAYY